MSTGIDKISFAADFDNDILYNRYQILRGLKIRVPRGEKVHQPPKGMICVYEDHLIHGGLMLPLCSFYVEVCRGYGLTPAQIAPNGWALVVAFRCWCQELELPATVRLFRAFLSAKVMGKNSGWYYFSARKDR